VQIDSPSGQVRTEVQESTGSHAAQTLASPADVRKKPGSSHSVHCELNAVVQVRGETHWVTDVHVTHTSAAPVSSRQNPDWHVGHTESVAVVHVSCTAHPSTPVHGEQTVCPSTSWR
jgi:hypothetical protein